MLILIMNICCLNSGTNESDIVYAWILAHLQPYLAELTVMYIFQENKRTLYTRFSAVADTLFFEWIELFGRHGYEL